jgi:hypothetical protein
VWETRTLPDIHTSVVAISIATAEVFFSFWPGSPSGAVVRCSDGLRAQWHDARRAWRDQLQPGRLAAERRSHQTSREVLSITYLGLARPRALQRPEIWTGLAGGSRPAIGPAARGGLRPAAPCGGSAPPAGPTGSGTAASGSAGSDTSRTHAGGQAARTAPSWSGPFGPGTRGARWGGHQIAA